MTKIDKIGNLTFYAERNEDESISLSAINGVDIVAREVYYGGTVRQAVDHMLRIQFDTVTFQYIRLILENVEIEHQGNLIHGTLPQHTERDYFKRIDNTDYYKHFTHRPRM